MITLCSFIHYSVYFCKYHSNLKSCDNQNIYHPSTHPSSVHLSSIHPHISHLCIHPHYLSVFCVYEQKKEKADVIDTLQMSWLKVIWGSGAGARNTHNQETQFEVIRSNLICRNMWALLFVLQLRYRNTDETSWNPSLAFAQRKHCPTSIMQSKHHNRALYLPLHANLRNDERVWWAFSA